MVAFLTPLFRANIDEVKEVCVQRYMENTTNKIEKGLGSNGKNHGYEI